MEMPEIDWNHTILPKIAFVGRAGAGKSTAASILGKYSYVPISFAGPLREVSTKIWGSRGSSREYLQKLGVAVREIDPDAWLNLATYTLDQSYSPRVVVDDCRFPNEYWALAERGFIFVGVEADRGRRIDRLKRSGKWQNEEQLDHESESHVDDFAVDFTIHNNDDSLLEATIDDLMRKLST